MASEYYLPTVDDVLRVRARSTGIMEIRFNMGQLPSVLLPWLTYTFFYNP